MFNNEEDYIDDVAALNRIIKAQRALIADLSAKLCKADQVIMEVMQIVGTEDTGEPGTAEDGERVRDGDGRGGDVPDGPLGRVP